MASIQKISSHGHRIYWRLYLPDGTSKEKYKTSRSKAVLQELLPDIMKIETLSQRNDLTGRDLGRAINLGIIRREEASLFSEQLDPAESHYLSELRHDFETMSRAQSSSVHSHQANLAKGNVIEEYFKEPIAQITPEAIEAFRAERRKGVTATTVNQDLKALRKYLDIAINKGWIRENPARKVKLLSEPKARIPRCLYPDELKVFLAGLEKYRHWLRGDIRFIMMFLLHTGLRRSEFCALVPENIKLHLRQVHLMGKGKKYRIVGIHKSLLPELKRRVKQGRIVDPALRPESISRGFKQLCRKIRLPEALTLHSLRHSFITYMLEHGVPPKLVQERAGHYSLNITARYSHAIPSTKVPEDILDFGKEV